MKLFSAVLACSIAAFGTAYAWSQAERQQLIDATLPPADRVGIEMIFPMKVGGFNSAFELAYDPAKVSESEVRARIAKICKANGVDGPLHVWNPSKAEQLRGPAGQVVYSTTLSCYPR